MSKLLFGVVNFKLCDVTNNKSNNGIADISFRKLVNKNNSSSTSNNNITEQNSSRMQGNDRLVSQTTISVNHKPPDSLPILSQIRNRYDNIIEQLEKKYSNPVSLVSNGNDMDSDIGTENNSNDMESEGDGGENVDDDDHDEEEDENKNEENPSTNITTGDNINNINEESKKKRKRLQQNHHDVYDMDDSFIDDTEALQEVEVAYRSQKIKTKHGGFFVNSGNLEVTDIQDVNDGGDNILSTSTTVDPTTGNNIIGETSAINEKRSKLVKIPELVKAFSLFSEAVSSCAITINKQRFPLVLTPDLIKVDIIAISHKVEMDSEYFTWIHEILRGIVPIPKIKSHLVLIRRREKATTVKEHLNKLITEFCDVMLKTKIIQISTVIGIIDSSTNGDGNGESNTQVTAMSPSPMKIATSQADADDKSSKNADAKITSNDLKLRWEVSSRSLLLEIEVQTLKWISLENEFRKILTSNAQKDLEIFNIEDAILLKEKDEITKMLKRISEVFPANCANTDVSYLRKMISVEKQRLRSLPTTAAVETVNTTKNNHTAVTTATVLTSGSGSVTAGSKINKTVTANSAGNVLVSSSLSLSRGKSGDRGKTVSISSIKSSPSSKMKGSQSNQSTIEKKTTEKIVKPATTIITNSAESLTKMSAIGGGSVGNGGDEGGYDSNDEDSSTNSPSNNNDNREKLKPRKGATFLPCPIFKEADFI